MPLLGRLSALASPATGTVCGARNASRAPPPHVLPLTAPVKAARSHHSHRSVAAATSRDRVQLSEFFTASPPTLKLSKSQGLNCVSVLIVPRCGTTVDTKS